MPVHTTPQGTTKATMSKAAAKRKRLKKLAVSRSENGGFIASHHYQPEHGGTPKSEKHVFSNYDDLHGHVEKTVRGHK